MDDSLDDAIPTRRLMSVSEFRELGYLREINRRMLHPMGLALQVTIEEDGTEYISGIWDERDDPEGIVFSEDTFTPEMIEQNREARRQWKQRRKVRVRMLGYMVQPIRPGERDS